MQNNRAQDNGWMLEKIRQMDEETDSPIGAPPMREELELERESAIWNRVAGLMASIRL